MSRTRVFALRAQSSATPTARALVFVSLVAALLFGWIVVAPGAQAQSDTGTLTVIKTEGEGSAEEIEALRPLEGVTFRINQLRGLTAQSQQELRDLVHKDPRLLTADSGYEMGPNIEATTDAQGRAVLADIPRGVYVVQELPFREGNTQYSAIAPFLIAVPDYQGNKEVQVRAKNQPITVAKTAATMETAAGELVSFTVTSTVPAPDRRGRIYQFVVHDVLDPNLQAVAEPVVTIVNGVDTRHLAAGRDFTYSYGPEARRLELELTQSGLSTLADLRDGHPETRVDVVIPTRVAADVPEGTVITNKAVVYPDGWPVPVLGDSVTGGVESNVAAVEIRGKQPVPVPTPTPGGSSAWPIIVPIILPILKPCPECVPCPDCFKPPAKPNGPVAEIINAITGGDNSAPRGDGTQGGSLADRLASTGASVIVLFFVAIGLLFAGFFLLAARRRRKKDEENDATSPSDQNIAEGEKV